MPGSLLLIHSTSFQCPFGANPMRIISSPNTVKCGVLKVLNSKDVAFTSAGVCNASPPATKPCVPAVVPGSWAGCATSVMVNGLPALISSSTCICTAGGGVIAPMPPAPLTVPTTKS